MARNINRALKKAKERSTDRLQSKLELLHAAYCLETKTHPKLAAVFTEDLSDGRRKYWFDAHQPTSQIADTHPDIQFLFSLAHGLNEAYKQRSNQDVIDGFQMLDTFFKRYENEFLEEEASKRASGRSETVAVTDEGKSEPAGDPIVSEHGDQLESGDVRCEESERAGEIL